LCFAAARILVQRNVESPDEVFASLFDVPGYILGKMFARLGDEVSEALENVVADAIAIRYSPFGNDALDFRVEI
jgi:hypothetical protein